MGAGASGKQSNPRRDPYKPQRKNTPKRSSQWLAENYKKAVSKALGKYQVLRDLDVFVLDTSIRETTVGQLQGHTLESKWKIYEEVKKCGFKHTVVAAFSHVTHVDDIFVMQLKERGEDPEGLWAFSEITEGAKDGVPDTEKVPLCILKLKSAGLYCVIFEIDLSDLVYNFKKFTVQDMCKLLNKWNNWCFKNLSPRAKVMINIRDLSDTMPNNADRVFDVVSYLAGLPANRRPFGLLFEEVWGKTLPEECGMWTRYIRGVMRDHGWNGHLLVHVHERYGYCDATALQVLIDGADGVWAGVCTEGSVMGHASTSVTLMNLVRLGNKKVLERYNCDYLREAAINVTRAITGKDPHPKQPVFGARATDFVFGFKPEEFDLAAFFGEKAPVRISTMASKEMIQQRLVNLFGEDPQFTLELTHKMKELILEDLRTSRREEYMSIVGLAMLFDRAGGSLNEQMRDAIDKFKLKGPNAENLLAEVRKIWNREWDLKDAVQGDNMLQYDSFYNGFMAPYFSCYRCSDTLKAMKAVDMDADGYVDWNEFETYLKWALHEYPNIADVEELLDVTFMKGLIPAMQDEFLKKN